MIECGVGDRIAFDQDGLDATGVIVEDRGGEYVVKLDAEYVMRKRGHDCQGRLGRYEGWYVYRECVTELLYQAVANRSCDISVKDLGSILNW